MPKPMQNSPSERSFGRRAKSSGSARPITGSVMLAMLNLNPKIDTIQNVVVVPMLAPMIRPTASTTVSSPALTKLTIITVVADEDCTRHVTRKPVPTPTNRLPVIVRMMLRNFSPESFWRASDMIFMPNRNMPRPPRMESAVRIMSACNGKV